MLLAVLGLTCLPRWAGDGAQGARRGPRRSPPPSLNPPPPTAIIIVTHDEKIIPTFRRLYRIVDGRTHEEVGEGRVV